ncbi:MAG: DUF554 domain-containing protein [Candidatus Nanopelagicaceae bacterium]
MNSHLVTTKAYTFQMFPGIGTVINVIAIVMGSIFGRLGGNRVPERTRSLITDVLGFITLISAAAAIKELWSDDFVGATVQGGPILVVLTSLILGAALGSWINVDYRLTQIGETLKKRFAKDDNLFVEGFVTASLLFVIGPLAILGSISDGMNKGIEQLLLKSSLDFFAAIAFSAAFGIGVLLSFIPVGIYQGVWTIIGIFLGNILSQAQVASMTAVGGVLLIGIGLKLLNVRNISVGNLLPALAFAPFILQLFQK